MCESGHYFRLKGESAEKVVHDLAEKSFFADWCYRNPALPGGKELCDLLVLFGDVAIIWQIKDLKLQENGRYNPKDVEKNLRQLRGAYRRLIDEKRPVTLRNPRRGEESFDPSRVKRVFLISALKGDGQSYLSAAQDVSGKFAHVLDGEFLDIALSELDTIQDFIDYLQAKEDLYAGESGVVVNGDERELLAYYLLNDRSFGRFSEADVIVIDEGIWDNLQQRPEHLRKKEADKVSYAWDSMIDRAHECGVPEYEAVSRELARPKRFARRVLAKAFFDAHVLAHEDRDHDVFRRVAVHDGVTYCFMFMDDPEPRDRRRQALQAFCFVARGRYAGNSTVIGIATEKTFCAECSYDFGYADILNWTEEDAVKAQRLGMDLGILVNVAERMVHEDEYPEDNSRGIEG